MYVEATMDLNEMIMHHPLQPPEAKEKNLVSITEKATTRYLFIYWEVCGRKAQFTAIGVLGT